MPDPVELPLVAYTTDFDDETKEKIRAGYEKDPFLQRCLANLESMPSVSKTYDRLLWVSGRRCIPNIPTIPDAILHDIHHSGGHASGIKDYRIAYPGFFWPTLCNDILKYARTCDINQKTKPGNTLPEGQQKQLSLPDLSLQSVNLDWTGKIIESKGYNSICVYVDGKTGFTVLVPTTDSSTAEDTAK